MGDFLTNKFDALRDDTADTRKGAVAAVLGGGPECEAQQCSCDRMTGFAHKQLLCEISSFRSKTTNPAQHINNGVCGDKGSANGAGAAVLGGGPRTCTTAHIRVSVEQINMASPSHLNQSGREPS